jgi:hypothetical protein
MKGSLIFSILLVSCCFLSCKKTVDKGLSFSGKVVNEFNNNTQADVTVKLYAQENSSTGVVGRAKVIAESVSDEEGNFRLTFDRTQVLDYEVQVSGNGIFYKEFKLEPDDVFEAKDLKQDIPVLVSSFAQIHLKNVDKSSPGDKFNIGSDLELACDCCPKEAMQFIGQVDTIYTCKIPAGKVVTFNTTRQAEGPLVSQAYTLVCGKGETCLLEIEY